MFIETFRLSLKKDNLINVTLYTNFGDDKLGKVILLAPAEISAANYRIKVLIKAIRNHINLVVWSPQTK